MIWEELESSLRKGNQRARGSRVSVEDFKTKRSGNSLTTAVMPSKV